ncbi:MAG: c-type cytochrome [Castellaniella sp.]
MRAIVGRALSWAFLLSVSWAGLPAAAAQTAGPLVQHRQCLACHQVDRKRVGPSFAAIAERYAGNEATDNAAAADYLARAIRQGSRQKWGAVPMPAQPGVSEDEALRLATWIIELANHGGTGKR